MVQAEGVLSTNRDKSKLMNKMGNCFGKKTLLADIISKNKEPSTSLSSRSLSLILHKPLTFKTVDSKDVPASFLAIQVYFPLCLYPTDEIIKMLVLTPIKVVVMAGSEEIVSPSKLHETESGKSPRLTLHVTCTNSPSSTESMPKENGVIRGGSEISIKFLKSAAHAFDFSSTILP